MVTASVLIAEGRAGVSRDIRRRLQGLGYCVTAVATSGEEAIEQADKTRPDLVLMDIGLQGQTGGIQAAGEIRQRWEIPVIYLTESGDRPASGPAEDTHPFAYIPKPFRTEELETVIDMAVMRHRLEDELKQAEPSLREAEQRYRRLFEHSPAVHLVLAGDGKILDANRTLGKILGYSKRELVGRHVLELVEPEDSGKVLEELEGALRGQHVTDMELRLLAVDGTPRTFLITPSAPETGKDGTSTGSLLTGIDITDRKAAEQLLHEQARRLEQVRKLKTVGRLAGGIAHHFNNLLTVILGNAQLLLADHREDAELLQSLDRIIDAARKGAEITAKLQSFSRSRELRMEALDVHSLLETAVELLEPALGADIEIVRDFRAERHELTADGQHLQNALMELGLNARDAMPTGGRITFATEVVALEGVVCPTSSCMLGRGQYMKIAVSDTGVGMDEETRARAFEPFFTTKEIGQAVGLGLSRVYGVVNDHLGIVQMTAPEGGGTRVTMYLPMDREPARKPVEV